MRSSAQVLIYLNVQKALDDGVPLFLSANSVILSPGLGPQGIISPIYFAAVVRAKDKTTFDPDFTAGAPKAWKQSATQSAIDAADFPPL
jgi:2'-phosphotransferase